MQGAQKSGPLVSVINLFQVSFRTATRALEVHIFVHVHNCQVSTAT